MHATIAKNELNYLFRGVIFYLSINVILGEWFLFINIVNVICIILVFTIYLRHVPSNSFYILKTLRLLTNTFFFLR